MDVRSRGTLSTSVGLLLAAIGFTLSVFSTLLRFLLPFYRPRGSGGTVAVSAIRRQSIRKHRRRSAAPSTLTNLSISSHASSSSGESSSSPPQRRRARSRSLERSIHIRNASERLDRPDFRTTDQPRRRRSESTPPTPSPRQWTFSKEETLAPPPETHSRRSSLHLSRAPSMDSTQSHSSHGHLSFLHMPKKLHRSSSVISSETVDPVEKRRSQIFAPLLHKRKSSEVGRWSMASTDETDDPSSASSPDAQTEVHSARPRPSIESIRHFPVPKRSQTLRTRPYEAPYFFPAPGSVEAPVEAAPPPRPRLERSGTLPVRRPSSGVY